MNPSRKAKGSAKPKINVPMERRLQLALGAGYEVGALAANMRSVMEKLSPSLAEDCDDETALLAFIDRLEIISDELSSVACFDDDHAHNKKELGARLRMVP